MGQAPYINADKYGNTSAASIPIALDEALREGKIKIPTPKGSRYEEVYGIGRAKEIKNKISNKEKERSIDD